jgi:anti-sigma factor RsiW
MNCDRYRDAIQELADGTLGAIRRAELQLHLDECRRCRALAADLARIRDLAASLDPAVPPANVWLQIAGRLRQEGRVAAPHRRAPRRHAALLAIAATLVIAIGAAIVMLLPRVRSGESTPPATAALQPAGNAAGDAVVQSVQEEFQLAEQHLQNAIAGLEQAAGSDKEVMDPQTAATLQKSLEVIDQAIAESRAALKSEPQSAPARDSLFDGLRRKVGLLQVTIALMNEMRKGNSAGAAQIVDGINKS